MNTHYDFTDWDDFDLIDIAIDPPFDIEATDWKSLAKRLAKRLESLHESLDRF